MRHKVRKIFISVLLTGLLTAHLFNQQIIENPGKPKNQRAGREVVLEEIMRITDDSGEFYFKGPRDLKVVSDGCIFLADEYQLLKISSEGKLFRNFFKRGQGPGEIQDYFRYAIDDGEIYVYDFNQRKIIRFDPEGHLINEWTLTEQYNDFYGTLGDRFIFLKSTWPPFEERTGKMMDIGERILQVFPDGIVERESPNFPIQAYMGQGFASWWTSFLCGLDGQKNILYISHTGEYLIEALNLEKNQLIRRFKRKYPRVKYKEREDSAGSSSRRKLPKRKYENDISQIFYESGLIWVVTSIKKENKGVLIDIFDENGRYLDNFFLKVDGSLMAVHRDFIFVRETDEMENIEIAKYEVKR